MPEYNVVWLRFHVTPETVTSILINNGESASDPFKNIFFSEFQKGGGSERTSYGRCATSRESAEEEEERLSCTPTVNYKHMTGIRPSVLPPAEKEGNKINMASGQQWVLVEMVQAFYEVRTQFSIQE